jgi:hypothetical protein
MAHYKELLLQPLKGGLLNTASKMGTQLLNAIYSTIIALELFISVRHKIVSSKLGEVLIFVSVSPFNLGKTGKRKKKKIVSFNQTWFIDNELCLTLLHCDKRNKPKFVYQHKQHYQ